ncbi:MAG: hypothetical protein U1E73_07035 [Planctomycetota bacterium]
MFRWPRHAFGLLAALLLVVAIVLPGLHHLEHACDDAAHVASCVECHHQLVCGDDLGGRPALGHGHDDHGDCALCDLLLLADQPFLAAVIGPGAVAPAPCGMVALWCTRAATGRRWPSPPARGPPVLPS